MPRQVWSGWSTSVVFVLVRLYVVVVRVVLVALVVIGELSPTAESASPGKLLVVGSGGGDGGGGVAATVAAGVVGAMVAAGVVAVVGGQRHWQLSNTVANSSV